MDLSIADNVEDESDELFSDDEQKRETGSNVLQDVSVSSRCEIPSSLLDSPNTIISTDAVIPSTPLSLLPFLSKKNEQWTSDLETPAQARTMPMASSAGTTEETPKLEERTPDLSAVRSEDVTISGSPVIAFRATKRRSKRRIFRSSLSIDPSAVTSNEDVTANAQVEAPVISDTNSVTVPKIGFQTARGKAIDISEQALAKARALFAQDLDDTLINDATNANPSLESALIDCKPKGLNRNQNTRNDESELLMNTVPDSLNISTQEFFSNASFSKIDELSFNTFNNRKTTEATATRCNNEQIVEDIGEERNVEENKSIGFFTARGAPIKVSEQALFKAKRLFADAFDADEVQSYESFTKRNSSEEKNRPLPSSSFVDNVSVNIAKGASAKPKPLTEQLKKCDKVCTTDCTKPLVNKSSGEEVNKVPILFSTASGNPINISKEALSKAKALLADELDNADDDTLMKYYEGLYADRNPMTVRNTTLPSSTSNSNSISISKKSPPIARMLFAKQDTPVEFTCKNKADISDNEQSNINTSNIRFHAACDAPVNSRARALFAGQSDDSLEPIVAREIYNDDNETKRQETKVPQIGFQTARGKAINVSEQALAKAKALFADHLDDTFRAFVAEGTNDDKVKGLEVKTSNVGFQSTSSTRGSEESPKAKISFKRLDNEPESYTAKATRIDDKVENRQEVKISSIGFQTARGTSINISERALSRARALFADELDCPLEMDILENIGDCRDDGRKVKKRDLIIPHDGLQTASGQRIPVSNNAALIARELFSTDYLDESNSDLGRASLQKRKLSETNVDESTPQGRNRASETKKARLSGEFQARRLFPGSPSVDMANDENQDSNVKMQAPSVAVFALGSPQRNTVEPIESDTMGSPVLGRQPILRKRKSFDRQRDECSAQADIKILNTENLKVQENVVQGSAADEKIEDDKLTKTPTPARVEKETAKGSNTESSDYGDTQMMMDFLDHSTKILQERVAAALEQEAIIVAKKRHGSKQSAGHLYRFKQVNSNARLSLRRISGGAPPEPRSHQELVARRISPRILELTAATAATYRFRCSDFYGDDVACNNVHGIAMEDGARVILDENGYAGLRELLRAFLASPSVDPNLVPARWVENHYRWVVWKLASMDRMKFGSAELSRALTPSHVMAQLKYRYDREIDRSQRPAIRRILEKDDVASKRMILCVSTIVENNNESVEIGKSPRVGESRWKIELTDGWYSINACIDLGAVRNISIGKIKEGTKLVVSGAELLNCDQGFHPLEAPADVCLKLHTNSTRRARWDTKLGYAPRSGPIPIKLRNVCPSGGLISKMTIVIARVYPMLYHEKTASGDSIVRNAKSEEKAQSKYEQQYQTKVEAFYAQAEELQGEGLSCEINDMAIQLNEDYENLRTEEFSKERHNKLLKELREKGERFKQRMQSKLRESLPGPRQVSQLLKVRVCDENANAILSVWSPSEEVVDALKEGACVALCNIVASGKRGTELQLTARRSAIFKPGKMRDTSYPARACMSLCEIANSEFVPPYGEFDTVGLVCSVGPAPYGMKDFEAVHLAHCKANSSDSSYLSILFWQGIASYGYTEILTVGSIVACSNLEWRRATSWNVPAAYCTERSTFTRNPRRNHLHESFENLRNLITDPIKYVERCAFELNVELQKKSTPTRYIAGKNTPIKIYSSTSSAAQKLADCMSPLATLGTGDRSNSIASNPSIQKRLEKLQHYGEAPELSPIILKNSKRISLDFQSPIRTLGVDSTKKSI
ncbi:PREDICTED: breast cancer type 2 susceptibility protein homolog [Vollenhovia emeryi]|uniref:breast cancer type 2 susceptibility protein homolog n=1 Tax=Vollenhovia emeryi TaxID=411798 RepID=UPI0005F50873|nr:PREDICTED: breast cancer type 2 susceptibility protein homolog [Vollenhovia emeryi]